MPKLSKFEQQYRYVGNRHTHEFHSLRRAKPQCQVDEIKSKTHYKRGWAAIADKMDACAFCAGHWKSKR